MSEQERIKRKINTINSKRWWGDDYDVRFYLISRLKNIKNKSILDVGGGIGMILSELNQNNFRINLDYSLEDLKTCRDKIDSDINLVCASMYYLPFRSDYFDYVICSHLLEIAKKNDLDKNSIRTDRLSTFPSVQKTLEEINRILLIQGMVFLTTPNNLYYCTNKLTFSELEKSVCSVFRNSTIFFYNTYRKLNKNNRKLDFANIVPKLLSKFISSDKVIRKLIKTKSSNNYSVSFFVEAIK